MIGQNPAGKIMQTAAIGYDLLCDITYILFVELLIISLCLADFK